MSLLGSKWYALAGPYGTLAPTTTAAQQQLSSSNAAPPARLAPLATPARSIPGRAQE